jgi:hypothetical protein
MQMNRRDAENTETLKGIKREKRISALLSAASQISWDSFTTEGTEITGEMR